MVAKGDTNPGSLDCESGILPLSYRAPQNGSASFVSHSQCRFSSNDLENNYHLCSDVGGGGCGSSVAQGVDVYPLVDYNVLDKNNPNKLCISKKEGKLH